MPKKKAPPLLPSGRFKTSSPDIQNIPIKSALGQEIRNKFLGRKLKGVADAAKS